MKLTTVGIDLAKNVFQVHGIDEHGKVLVKKQLRRDQVATFFVNLPSCGKLRALAVTSATRSNAYPKVPTMVEAGVPGYATEGWYGIHAPAGTPSDVIQKLNAATRKAAQTDFFKSKLVHEGMVSQTGTPGEYEPFVRAEIARWAKLVKTDVISK